MKPLSLAIAVLCLSVLPAACVPQKPPLSSGQQINLLVATSGTVYLKRDGWKDYVPVAAGVRLASTDLLKADGSASVLCAGPEVITVTAMGKTPCPTERGSYVYDGARFSGGQRGTAADIPYIAFPRSTMVLDPRPLLTWHDTGSAPYTVSIVEGAKVVWEQGDIAGTALQYPMDAPALRPDTDYLLIVRDAAGKSSEEDPAKGLGFRVVSAAARPEVERQREEILKLAPLDPPAQQLALAVYYATWRGDGERGFWGEALRLLEQVAQVQDTPAVRLWMGDVAWAVSLPDEAEAAYSHAHLQAQDTGDRASQAAAAAGLWRVTGERDWLDAALRLYDELGDQREAKALQDEAAPQQ